MAWKINRLNARTVTTITTDGHAGGGGVRDRGDCWIEPLK
jgi:hypothetical protein